MRNDRDDELSGRSRRHARGVAGKHAEGSNMRLSRRAPGPAATQPSGCDSRGRARRRVPPHRADVRHEPTSKPPRRRPRTPRRPRDGCRTAHRACENRPARSAAAAPRTPRGRSRAVGRFGRGGRHAGVALSYDNDLHLPAPIRFVSRSHNLWLWIPSPPSRHICCIIVCWCRRSLHDRLGAKAEGLRLWEGVGS